MLLKGYTSVSHLVNTEPSELLRLWLSEPIASESEHHRVKSICQTKLSPIVNEGELRD